MFQVEHKRPKETLKLKSPDYVPTDSHKEAAAHFTSIFGRNNMRYKFPYITDLKRKVSNALHSLEDAVFLYMDIELAFPEYKICCPKCGCDDLERERHMFSYSRRFFPIVDDKSEVWCLPFRYRCKECPNDGHDSNIFFTNDCEFLAKCPAYIRRQYPVDPRYAQRPGKRQCHLSRGFTGNLREDMAKYSSASETVRRFARRRHDQFLEQCDDFYSRPFSEGRYLDCHDVVRTYPPSDHDCRTLHLEAQTSTLNPESMSSKDRFERQMQMTQIRELGAGDHTFETLKNYNLPPEAKAVYTVNNEIGQLCNFVIVASQAMKEVDHMFAMMLTKRGWDKTKKIAFYTDTWPNDSAYYKKLARFEKFYLIKDRLQQCIYKYNCKDYEAVIEAIRVGLFSSKGDQLTQVEIDSIRMSKAWHQNYTKYMQKEIRSCDEIVQNLIDFVLWIEQIFAIRNATGQVQRDSDGNVVVDESFLVSTSSWKRFRHQIDLNKVTAKGIQDPEGIEMYYAEPAGPKSKHQLPTYTSKRPEPKLEGLHGEMKHWSNGGMRPALADITILQGATEWNHRMWIKHKRRQRDPQILQDPNRQFMPNYLKDEPVFYNHAMLEYLNKVAKSKNVDIHFPNCMEIPKENNDEKFGSEYFFDQQIRNDQKLWTNQGWDVFMLPVHIHFIRK